MIKVLTVWARKCWFSWGESWTWEGKRIKRSWYWIGHEHGCWTHPWMEFKDGTRHRKGHGKDYTGWEVARWQQSRWVGGNLNSKSFKGAEIFTRARKPLGSSRSTLGTVQASWLTSFQWLSEPCSNQSTRSLSVGNAVLQAFPPGGAISNGEPNSKQSLEARKVCLSLSSEDP